MLDIKFIRENPEKVREGLKKKGVNFDLDGFLALDEKRRKKIQEVDVMRTKQNEISEEIAKGRTLSASRSDLDGKIEESKQLKAKLGDEEFELKALEEEFTELLRKIPNLPLDSVPAGKDEREYVVLREVGEKPSFKFKPKDYMETAGGLGLIDTERAAKVSGSRFGYLTREAALLEFALVRLAMDLVQDEKNIKKIIKGKGLDVTARPFVPVVPPVLIKPEAMKAMGYVERGGEEIYFLEKDNLYLVGTSEQSVGPMHTDEILAEAELPLRYISFSTCFRREAGSHGKDTKGILRVHQFDKAEMFVFCSPETSKQEHELLLGIEEKLMQELKISYRVLNICAGDLGDPAAAKYDIEAWLPGQNNGKGEYRETHSTSNTTDFQARRLNIKIKRENGKTEFLHTLNGTAFAIGRMLIAILENYQEEDGSVKIPKVLQKYMPRSEISN